MPTADSGRSPSCFNKLALGILSAPEHFLQQMSELLPASTLSCLRWMTSLSGGRNKLSTMNTWRQPSNVPRKLGNPKPTEVWIQQKKITFLGHVIDSEGIRADPEKTEAIRKMSQPTSVSELRRLMGMINQLGKFTPNLAEITQPLHDLLSKLRTWTWGPSQSRYSHW